MIRGQIKERVRCAKKSFHHWLKIVFRDRENETLQKILDKDRDTHREAIEWVVIQRFKRMIRSKIGSLIWVHRWDMVVRRRGAGAKGAHKNFLIIHVVMGSGKRVHGWDYSNCCGKGGSHRRGKNKHSNYMCVFLGLYQV